MIKDIRCRDTFDQNSKYSANILFLKLFSLEISSFYCRIPSRDCSGNKEAKNNTVLLSERATEGSSFAAIENRLFLLMYCNEKREKASNREDYNKLIFS